MSRRVMRCPMNEPAIACMTVFIMPGKDPMSVRMLKTAVKMIAPISAPAGILSL